MTYLNHPLLFLSWSDILQTNCCLKSIFRNSIEREIQAWLSCLNLPGDSLHIRYYTPQWVNGRTMQWEEDRLGFLHQLLAFQ